MPETSVVKLHKETLERLKSVKHPGQTIDGIVNELINEFERKSAVREH